MGIRQFAGLNSLLKRISGLLCIVALIVQVVGCDKSMTEQEYVERALSWLDQGDLEAASIDLKNALQLNPKDAQARWLLGTTYSKSGKFFAASKELKRAQELGVQDDSVLPLLATVLLEQGSYEEVLGLDSATSLSVLSRAKVLAARGSALLALDKPVESSNMFEQALSLDPKCIPALVGKAQLMVSREEFEKGRDLLQSALKIDAVYAPAWDLLGDINQIEKKPDEAAGAYTHAIESDPRKISSVLKRIFVRIQLKDYQGAESDIDGLKWLPSEHGELNYLKGALYFSRQQYPEASQFLETTVGADPSHYKALYLLGATQFMLGNREQAERSLQQFLENYPNHIPARRYLALLKLQRKDYAEVEKLIRPLVMADPEDILSVDLLANALMMQGKMEEGTHFLDQAANIQPDSVAGKLRLGLGLLIQGDAEGSMEPLRSALEKDSGSGLSNRVLVQSLLLQKQYAEALNAAQLYQSRHPKAAEPYVLMGMIYLAQGKSDKSEAAFGQALEAEPGNPTANYILATISTQRGDLEKSREFLKAVLTKRPDDLATLLHLSKLDAQENKEDAMVNRLQQAVSAHPNAVLPRVLLARYHLKKGQPEKVPLVLGNLLNGSSENSLVLTVLGRSQLAENRGEEAKLTLKRLVALNPQSVQAQYLLATAYSQIKDWDNLIAALSRVLDLDEDHFEARLALARLKLLERNIDDARKHLAHLQKKWSDHPNVLFLEGAIAKFSGDSEGALKAYEKMYRSTNSASSMLALAQQQWEIGDKEGSVSLLKQWVSERPDDTAARIALANSYFSLDQTEQALGLYAKVLEEDGNNVVALNDLAWNLRDRNPQQALLHAKKASELAPDSASISDTLAVVLMKNGAVDEAMIVSEKAVRSSKGNPTPTILYHQAEVLEAKGLIRESARVLERLLSDQLTFPERGDAEQMLSRLRNR